MRPQRERHEAKRRASAADPRLRWLAARHRELSQEHNKAAQAADNMDRQAFASAWRRIRFLLTQLVDDTKKASEQP
jgi:Asp-tRNA(Asn)/Glu-tRNA(Gln) amidotransferase A subunit family amidase